MITLTLFITYRIEKGNYSKEFELEITPGKEKRVEFRGAKVKATVGTDRSVYFEGEVGTEVVEVRKSSRVK